MILGNPTFIAAYPVSNVTELEITSGLDSTYSSYMFVFTDMYVHTNAYAITFQTGASYNTATTTAPMVAYMYERMGNGSDDCMAGVMILNDPASTVHDKYLYYNINHTMDLGPASVQTINQGQIKTTGAITQIKFKAASGNISGTIQLYGIT